MDNRGQEGQEMVEEELVDGNDNEKSMVIQDQIQDVAGGKN
jgi:hypothetical protein